MAIVIYKRPCQMPLSSKMTEVEYKKAMENHDRLFEEYAKDIQRDFPELMADFDDEENEEEWKFSSETFIDYLDYNDQETKNLPMKNMKLLPETPQSAIDAFENYKEIIQKFEDDGDY